MPASQLCCRLLILPYGKATIDEKHCPGMSWVASSKRRCIDSLASFSGINSATAMKTNSLITDCGNALLKKHASDTTQ